MAVHGRTTIHDVARAAGVSAQTVSNVMRGQGRVGNTTRLRVSAAIDALSYSPHAGAASLRTRRSGRLAHPITVGERGPANTIMLEFIQSLTSAAGRHDQHLLLTAGGAAGMGDIEQLLRSGSVDGVVLAHVARHDERIRRLARLGASFACFGRTEPDMPQNWIDIDNREAVRQATSHLISAGHARLAFLGYPPRERWDIERLAGYKDAMTASGLRARAVTPRPDAPHVRQAIRALLGASSPPTAIVTGSDVLAGAVYTEAGHRGIGIGSDLAVTGFDGSMVGRLLTPALTTLTIPITYITDWLVTRALAERDGPSGAPGEVVVPDLILGASG
jgi:DNA-binding LacI/PurR family transcriptional regulator